MTAGQPAGVRKGEWPSLALIAGCALMAIVPLLWRGSSCGHDFDFHLQSWMEVARQWREGVWYPRWIDSANYGAGEPRLVFYPPVSWLLGGALGAVLSWTAAPVVFVLLSLMGCGLSCYAFAREWLTAGTARAAACAYLVNPYLLFVVYERGAYGELLAGVWVPLVLLFALRRRASLAPLALTLAAVWLTNAPAAVMACYTVALLGAFTAIQARQWRPLLRAAGGNLLGMGLAGFYIVPAAYERRWVAIARAIGPGMRVEDSFLFAHTGEAFHDQVLRTASWIAVALLTAAAVAAWRAERRGENRAVSRALTGLVAVIAILLLPFSEFIWQYTPELNFLQFPWRWLLVAGAAAAVLFGLAIPKRIMGRGRTVLTFAAIVATAALLTGVAARFYWQPCDDEDAVSAQVHSFESGGGFEGTDEYAVRDGDNGAIQRGLPPMRLLVEANGDSADGSAGPNPEWTETVATHSRAQISIDAWSAVHKVFRVQTATAGFAVLRMMEYPAWRVRVNGVEVAMRPRRSDGLLVVPVTAGLSAIDVKYERTPDVLWGLALSIAALLLLIGLAAREKKWQTHQIL